MASQDALNILSIPVKFPFTPYECQIEYMRNVISSLQQVRQRLVSFRKLSLYACFSCL